MRYRRLGRTNEQVSELSYGAARGASTDPAKFIATVHAAIDSGVNLIDTAAGYDGGHSERVLGDALKGRDKVLVETKYCPYDSYLPEAIFNGTPEALIASTEESLRRLKRDRIDILLGHGIRTLESLDHFMKRGCFDAMLRLRDQGKVRYVGISELSEGDGTHEVLQRSIPWGKFDVVMLTVNFLLQTAIDSVLPLCEKYDVGTVVMMPLNQASKESGLVSYEAALECIRRHVAAGNLPNRHPYTSPRFLEFLKPRTIPEIALRFVLMQNISTCCVGVRSAERWQENLAAMEQPYLGFRTHSALREFFARIQKQER